MISISKCIEDKLDLPAELTIFMKLLRERVGINYDYLLVTPENGGKYISEDEMIKVLAKKFDLPMFARIPNSHLGFVFDTDDVIRIDKATYIDGPIIFGMHHGDVFSGLEEADYNRLNKEIFLRKIELTIEGKEKTLYQIMREDLAYA